MTARPAASPTNSARPDLVRASPEMVLLEWAGFDRRLDHRLVHLDASVTAAFADNPDAS